MPTRQGVQHSKASQLGPSFQAGYDIAEPVESGSVNVAASHWRGNDLHVVHRYAAIALDPTQKWNWVIHFALREMKGRTPTITWNRSEQGSNLLANELLTPSFSYNNRDWTQFSNISSAADDYLICSHSSAFTNDLVYVWFQPPCSYIEYLDWLRSTVFSSQYASATASESIPGSFIIAYTEPRTVIDSSCGVARPAQPFHGFKLQWAPGATKLCVLSAGIHGCGERLSRLVLRGIVDYLLTSSDAEAIAVRNDWIFLVYPHMNPLGEICGSNRGWGSDLTVNPNRRWDHVGEPVAFLDSFKTLALADVAAIGITPSLVVDLHNDEPDDGVQYLYTSTVDAGGDFYTLFNVREPTLDEWEELQLYSGWWIHWMKTQLSATMHLIYETNSQSTEAEQFSRGANFVKTISDAVTAGIL